MVYRGLKRARSDWTPLARQFHEGLLSRIFHDEPSQAFVTDYARSMLDGQMDALLVYRKRLRHRLDTYEVNVPPQVRAARIADTHKAKLNRPQQYQRGGGIKYVITQGGPAPWRRGIHALTMSTTSSSNCSRLPMRFFSRWGIALGH